MSLFGVFDHRFRGFRVVEIGGVGVLLVLILVVYLAKTGAGVEGADIDRVQQQISDEQARVTLLRAEVASLEQPERLESLSDRYLHLQPVDAKHEVDPQALADIAHPPAPQPKPAPAGAPKAPAAAGPDVAAAAAPAAKTAADDPIARLAQSSPAATTAPPAATAEPR